MMSMMIYDIVQESYAMLNKYQISVVKEEMERVDTLRFQYGNLQSKAVSIYSHYHTNTI